MPFPRVVIESPFAPNPGRSIEDNMNYARDCLRHSIARGEAPFASHLLYTQVLNDRDEAERERGIALNLRYIDIAALLAVYVDFGISSGMRRAINHAKALRLPIEFRNIIQESKN